jgi:trehalose 6-phosphate phosphatase
VASVALDRLVGADRAGLFLDFDGTLSEIVRIPSEARPLPDVPELLDLLDRRFAVVAVVSGRSAVELVDWLGPGVEIWGVHGAERNVDGRVVLSDHAARYAELMSRVRDEATEAVAMLDLPGVVIEDKRVMVGLHFRAAEDPDEAKRALEELAARLSSKYGLTRAGGRLAFELRPPIEFSKRRVVLDRARGAHLQAAAFVGDDRVDIPAFDALDELEAGGVTTVRIAVNSTEAPPELLERADVVVPGPAGVVKLLRSLLEMV